MARWRARPVRLEAPEWYRVYHPEAWDTPDAQEERMMEGWPAPWPDELHEYHAERRWHEAQHAYRQDHPEFASQEFADLLASVQARRGGRADH